MSPRLQSSLANLGALALIAVGFFFLVHLKSADTALTNVAQPTVSTTNAQIASAGVSAVPPLPAGARSARTHATSTVKIAANAPAENAVGAQQPAVEAVRIQNPYSVPPESSADVNDAARAALVNILCMPRGGGSLSPISGSGVIIDPRGVILTNAHVAQYVLLSESPQIDLSCVIRNGAPAAAHWSAEVLYIPPVWVQAHANEIMDPKPLGTGEHDYGLLLITGSLDGSPLPASFPSLPVDTREGIGFQGDQVLAASYPAEFLGGYAAEFDLYPDSSVTTIGQLLTFASTTIDLISLGGIIEAQSGSSGGAVVNAWGRLIGIIATTSEGATTANRDLRAITLSYISRDLAAQTQFDLPTMLGGDVAAEATDFNANTAPGMINLYLAQISK